MLILPPGILRSQARSIATGEQPSKRRDESEASLLVIAGCGRRALLGDGIERSAAGSMVGGLLIDAAYGVT